MLAKLVLTLLAVAVLLLEAPTVGTLARAAAPPGTDPTDLPSTLPHSVGGLVVLLLALILSVFKPRGLTRYGWRKTGTTAGRPGDRDGSVTPVTRQLS